MGDAKSESQVQQQCNEMEKLCEVLHKVIHDLTERLAPVVAVRLEVDKSSVAMSAPSTLVPLAQSLESRNASIQQAIDQINALRGRIEL